MAPRKRQKLMRIDAALDAMRPLGFGDALVRKTVRDLLKEYGGNESWPFIEEASYTVLIETLLKIPNEEEEDERDDCDEEERLHEKQVVEHNDEAGGLVLNEDIGDERERVDQQLELYEQGVVDEDVCQEDEVDSKNHLSQKDENSQLLSEDKTTLLALALLHWWIVLQLFEGVSQAMDGSVMTISMIIFLSS